MLFDLNNSNIRNLLKKAEFGIERESLRVTSDGRLAQTEHPFVDAPHIDRDFCENQIEIIGDVFYCPDGINRQLNQILDEIDERISGNNELIWPFSNPPKISSEDEIPVAQFGGKLKSKSEYRYYLAEKYGKKKMLFSGIHLNYSFSNQLLKTAYLYGNYSDFDEFRNGVYLRLAKRLTQYELRCSVGQEGVYHRNRNQHTGAFAVSMPRQAVLLPDAKADLSEYEIDHARRSLQLRRRQRRRGDSARQRHHYQSKKMY